MKFYVGLHHPADARHFERAFISVNAVARRRSAVPCDDWIMDSGAFTQISTHGNFVMSVGEYAEVIRRLRPSMAVSQDWMCEQEILAVTGLTVFDHQRLTIDRYYELTRRERITPIMPVIQGYEPFEYVEHVRMYGDLLPENGWVGVGSVCKRNTSPSSISAVLRAIRDIRPDLRLHGFGVKYTALHWAAVRDLLYSADSMAWSYAARLNHGNGNDWRYARRFVERIENQMVQESLGCW